MKIIRKAFTRKIRVNTTFDYWVGFQKHHLFSLERRRERYRIIYVWKILEGMVPNLTGRSQITDKQSFRFGRMCVLPPVATAAKNSLQRLRERSFCVNGPKLFNSLPSHLRNMTGVSHLEFKRELDKFLGTIADEPLMCGYTARRRTESNSLIPACKV